MFNTATSARHTRLHTQYEWSVASPSSLEHSPTWGSSLESCSHLQSTTTLATIMTMITTTNIVFGFLNLNLSPHCTIPQSYTTPKSHAIYNLLSIVYTTLPWQLHWFISFPQIVAVSIHLGIAWEVCGEWRLHPCWVWPHRTLPAFPLEICSWPGRKFEGASVQTGRFLFYIWNVFTIFVILRSPCVLTS